MNIDLASLLPFMVIALTALILVICAITLIREPETGKKTIIWLAGIFEDQRGKFSRKGAGFFVALWFVSRLLEKYIVTGTVDIELVITVLAFAATMVGLSLYENGSPRRKVNPKDPPPDAS